MGDLSAALLALSMMAMSSSPQDANGVCQRSLLACPSPAVETADCAAALARQIDEMGGYTGSCHGAVFDNCCGGPLEIDLVVDPKGSTVVVFAGGRDQPKITRRQKLHLSVPARRSTSTVMLFWLDDDGKFQVRNAPEVEWAIERVSLPSP